MLEYGHSDWQTSEASSSVFAKLRSAKYCKAPQMTLSYLHVTRWAVDGFHHPAHRVYATLKRDDGPRCARSYVTLGSQAYISLHFSFLSILPPTIKLYQDTTFKDVNPFSTLLSSINANLKIS